jgi:excisionase family DNA binding protein
MTPEQALAVATEYIAKLERLGRDFAEVHRFLAERNTPRKVAQEGISKVQQRRARSLTAAERVFGEIRSQLAEIRGALTNPPPPSPWLTTDQAADYLAYKPQRVVELARAGKIDHRKPGKAYMFRVEWLDAYVEGSRP